MQTLRQTLQIFLPLVVGIGLLAGLPKIPALVEFEHALFWRPTDPAGQWRYLERGKKEDFEMKVFQRTLTALVRTDTTHQIDPETEDILGKSPLEPSNWAYLLSQLTPEKTDLLVITNELSWSDAEEIPIRALQHQISRFPASVIGLDCEKTGDSAPIPDYLHPSMISKFAGYPPDLQEIDRVIAPPSVKSTYFGVSSIRGLKIEQGNRIIKIPLLVRWADQILPSVELASLLATFKIKPSELVIDHKGFIRLNRNGPIFLKIDEQGFSEVHSRGNHLASASEFLTSPPDFRDASIIIASQEAPIRLKNLAGTFSEMAMSGQHLETTIRRWPLIIEASFLIILVLSFTTRRLLPALLLIAIGYLVSTFFSSQWFILSPMITLLIAYFIFFRRKSTTPEEEPKAEKKPERQPKNKSPRKRGKRRRK
jgi:hypothetical protein